MKILITGAGGMLGSDLAEAFSGRFSVAGAGLSDASHLNVPYHVVDLAEPRNVRKLFEREKPDLIFHAAAMTQVDACESRREEARIKNVEVTRHVSEASNRSGAFLILFSTDYVFDGFQAGEYKEGDTPNPLNYYGQTKLEAEKMVAQMAGRYAIFRLSWLFGFHGPSFPRTILKMTENKTPLSIVNDQHGRPSYTRDIAEAFCHLLDLNPQRLFGASGETFHLANQGSTSWADFAELIVKTRNHRQVPIQRISSEALGRPARRPKNSVLSLRKTEARLGMRLRSWQEAAVDFIQNHLSRETNYAPS